MHYYMTTAVFHNVIINVTSVCVAFFNPLYTDAYSLAIFMYKIHCVIPTTVLDEYGS